MPDYALEGPSWSAPLNITYAWGDTTTRSYSGSTNFTSAITGAYQTLVTQAMQAWEAVANVHFTLISSTAGANIDFGWMDFSAAGQLGVTQYSSYTNATGKNVFVSGTFVGFEDPAYRAVGSDQTSLYSGYNTTLFQIMMHEIGHALGLAHSTNPSTLMYPYLGASDRAITQADITGIQVIYGAPSGSAATTASTTTLSHVSISADSGTAGDFVTNVAAQTIGATLSAALVSGETVLASVNRGTTWIDVTGYVSGTTLAWTTATLSGSSTIKLKVTNPIGDGAVASQSYALDTTAPTTAVSNVALSADSNVAGDLVTNVAAQTITGILGAPLAAGDKLYGSTNGGLSWTDVTSKVTGVAITWNGATLATGTSSLQFKVVDLAGNNGTISSTGYTLDVAAPTTVVSAIRISSDSGVAGDFVTNVAAQTVTGTLNTGLSGGDSLYGSLDGGATWTNVTGMVSGTSITWTGAVLQAGVRSIALRVGDLAGNVGTVGTQSYTLDVTPPATPSGAPTLAAASDSGVVGDRITNVAAPTITGSGVEAGSTVRLYDSNGTTVLGAATAAAGGGWSITSAALAEGVHTLTVKATDTAGNVSGASPAMALRIDTTAPPATLAPVLSAASDSGIAGDRITNVTTPSITGTGAEAASTVRLYDSDGVTLLGTAVATATGTYGIVSSALADGTHTLTVKATDAAGNVGARSSPLSVTIDTAPPDAPATAPTQTHSLVETAPTVVNTVYRFFDSRHGTQFLTSDAAERDTIISTRPDLAYEGKAMGSVGADTTNPNVAPVYRFFDGSNGTHFFTTSSGERDQILANRHNMVLEQTNMFQHVHQQAGDVAVYRFFEKSDGSHFFTSDQTEIGAITQTRPDMVAEGISFYAPKV